MRTLAFIFVLFAFALVASAQQTNYFCIVCGKGPLTGRVWMSKWGPICDDCAKLETRCSICGLSIRDGDSHAETGDGRFICRFDKTNAVLNVAEAREVFEAARRDLVNLIGPDFALKYPNVTVNLFDVDYWSEKGREDGLHKYGFASTRRAPGGQCTHEVILISGRLRDEIAATAAHEYTHLWINENLTPNRKIAVDTAEAICELAAYKLMESRSGPEQQQKILENPYTHGEIKNLMQVENKYDMNYVLNWVKTGTTETLGGNRFFRPGETAAAVFATHPTPPESLAFGGLITIGTDLQAVVNGAAFAAGDTKRIRLRDKTVLVHCREVRRDEVVLDVEGLRVRSR